jgi:hypothetical protein
MVCALTSSAHLRLGKTSRNRTVAKRLVRLALGQARWVAADPAGEANALAS